MIANPFGPHEHLRVTSYVARLWSERNAPVVATPEYVRDNIHVSLLARAYGGLVEALVASDGFIRAKPSGYWEAKGISHTASPQRWSAHCQSPCPLEIKRQQDVSAPLVRTNTEELDPVALGWNEEEAWDALAADYSVRFLQPSVR